MFICANDAGIDCAFRLVIKVFFIGKQLQLQDKHLVKKNIHKQQCH